MGQKSEEWSRRIGIWLDEIQNQFFEELEPVLFEAFFTRERLSVDDALTQTFKPVTEGTPWGGKWEYGWFRTNIILPETAQDKCIMLCPKTGGEMLVWVNGRIAGSIDREHHGILLTHSGKAGDCYTIITESYAGHGPMPENGGPVPPERTAVPEPPKYQAVVAASGFGIWNEEAFSLYMDAFTLYKLYITLDPESLRAQRIKKGLQEFTKIVDFELPRNLRNNTYQTARKVLEPLLSCVNGSTMPEYTIFGQSHLDVAWKWPWEETRRKCGRTFSNQVTLSDEYPEYKFLICEPVLIESVKKDYPGLYRRIIEKVRKKQFIPEGGVWVEADTNIPSGESLIRQCIWGKRWFQKEFGIDTRMVWLPDCFGFSGQLPQIFIGTGMKYFTTQKIFRAMKGCDVFPYNIFQWEGIDGTRILTHLYYKNNSRYDPELLINRWYKDRVQQEDIDTFLFPFGFGDGGGGPTREMLEVVKRTKDLEGVPRTRMQSPVAFFEEIEKKGTVNNRYVGELYFAWHRGTYTAQAKTKKGNRRAEIALHELEFWETITGQYNTVLLNQLWEKLLFNQFHDILAGASITRVGQEAERDFADVIEKADKLCKKDLEYIAAVNQTAKDSTGSMTVFNTLSWARNVLVRLPENMTGALDYDKKPLQVQRTGHDSYINVRVPSCGFTTVYPYKGKPEDEEGEQCRNSKENSLNQGSDRLYASDPDTYGVRVTKNSIENELLRIELNNGGQITSIFDKEAQIEYAAGLCNRMCMYKDVNVDYDAWEISNYYDEMPVSLSQAAQMEVIAEGSLFGTIRIKLRLNQSDMVQDITMTAKSRRVDFKTTVDWQETHKLLKAEFPVNVFTDEAIEEIQFGYVKRPTHKSRQYDADRFEVCNQRYTAFTEENRCFAVLNDCKYGVSTNENKIQLSLLRAPLIPDMYADKGIQEFTYSFYADHRSFAQSGTVRQGYELNVPASVIFGAAGEKSYFTVSNQDIILETVKPAQDGSGDIILRLYEAKKSHASCTLKILFNVIQASQVNMLEDMGNREPLTIENNTQGDTLINLSFRPFEIKTVRLIMNGR